MNDQCNHQIDHPNSALRAQRRQRAWKLAAFFLVATLAGLGCDPISTLSYFILPFSDNSLPPACPLAIKGKESTVVFICNYENSAATNASGQRLQRADEEICSLLVQKLRSRYKENGDKIKIVGVPSVYKYLSEQPNWASIPKKAIGQHFNADLVVYLEIARLTMWEKGSAGQLYSGNAEIRMSVIDLAEPEGEQVTWHDSYITKYPSTYQVDSFECDPETFKQKFFDHVAKGLMQYFASHTSEERAGPDQ
jgi:hypothetical protein